MQNKEDKVGNKTVYKEGRQRKKYRERDWERSKYILKKVPILVCALLWKICLITAL